MKKLACEMCGSPDLVKQDGVFVCQYCGMQYSAEEAKKLMIEGTVDVQGTVKVDNSSFVEKYLANARRAKEKEDWEEVEKYYNMVEQNVPNNIEAVFFSSYAKVMVSLLEGGIIANREQRFHVLVKSISVINDYFETSTEDKEKVLNQIFDAIKKMFTIKRVPCTNGGVQVVESVTKDMINSVRTAFITELQQIKEAHPDLAYIDELITKTSGLSTGGCYVATAVYGSYDCPQVWTLRRYRDNTLANTWYGRTFIHTYYAISPTLVKWFGHTNWFKKMWKGKLDRMVETLQDNGVESTPYEDKNW